MRIPAWVALLLLYLLPALPVQAQSGPANGLAFNAEGLDSASGQLITVRLKGKPLLKGRQYAGTCRIQPGSGKSAPTKLAGEWVLTQQSDVALAIGARPAIAGIGTRVGKKPLRPGQRATTAGQALNFTIEAQADGRYQVLLLDAFNDETLDFRASATAATAR